MQTQRQWDNLKITFLNPNGKKFEIGENTNYRIEKGGDLFSSLMVSPIDDRVYSEREITVSLILSDMKDTRVITDFFTPNINYNLDILADGQNYVTVARINKSFSISGIESLYGTNEKHATVKLNLICENPVFYEQQAKVITEDTQSKDLFKYPYYLPSSNNEYFIFELKLPQRLIIIDNKGNDANGIEVKITAYAFLKNPTLINETTRQSMTIEANLEKGNVMEINTGTLGNPYVKINGEIQYNAKRLFDKWFKIERGINMIRFKSENGEENCEVVLYYRNKYRGL